MTRALLEAAKAWLAALDGDRSAAATHMRTAVQQLPHEQLLDRAMIHLACAEASSVLGDLTGSRDHRRTAISLYRAKGNVVGAAHNEALL
jgi:ATP/maltotriose-dependent transcriptional regulator MalT